MGGGICGEYINLIQMNYDEDVQTEKRKIEAFKITFGNLTRGNISIENVCKLRYFR